MSPSRLLLLGPIALLIPGGFTLLRGRSLRAALVFLAWLSPLVASALGLMSLVVARLAESFNLVTHGLVHSMHLALWRPQR